MQYVLFVDESNTSKRGWDPNFQIAGFWAPVKSNDQVLIQRQIDSVAVDLIDSSLKNSGLPESKIHANEARNHSAFSGCVKLLFDGLPSDWRIARITNSNHLDFGDFETNYLMTLGQLVTAVKGEIAQLPQPGPLHIIAARVMDPTTKRLPDDKMDEVERKRYIERVEIEKNIAFSRSELSYGKNRQYDREERVYIDSARKNKALMICDWISYCSHTDFKPLVDHSTPEVLNFVKKRFSRDFVFDPQAANHRIRGLLLSGRYGEAAIPLASEKSLKPQTRKEYLDWLVSSWADLPDRQRNNQLSVLLSYWEDLVERLRASDGSQVLQSHYKKILEPLQKKIRDNSDDADNSIAPLIYTYYKNLLEIYNHHGDVKSAQHIVNQLQIMLPDMAKHWDHLEIILESQCHIGVHLTDAFQQQEAVDLLSPYIQFTRDLGGLFNDALPEIFPKDLKYVAKGKLLGTCLQALADLVLTDSDKIHDARKLSDEAIDEFSDPVDIHRQYQYRSQMECHVGEFELARQWLGKSMALEKVPSHAVIAEEIARRIQEDAKETAHKDSGHPNFDIGFLLLHWSRIGARAALSGTHKDEAQLFVDSLGRFPVIKDCSWLTAQKMPYPAHGIRRYFAPIYSFAEDYAKTQEMIHQMIHLQGFQSTDSAQVLDEMFLNCAQCEAATIQIQKDETRYWNKLMIEKAQPLNGLNPRLRRLLKSLNKEPGLASLAEYAQQFLDLSVECNNNLKNEKARTALVKHSLRFSH